MSLFEIRFSVRTPINMNSHGRRRPVTEQETMENKRLELLHKPYIPPVPVSECGTPHNFQRGGCVNCLTPDPTSPGAGIKQ